MEELKSCPFCGEELDCLTMCIETQDREINPDNVIIRCYHCGAAGPSAWSKEEAVAAWNRRAAPEITGETSDGYHTFNELYHHRAVLFSVICNSHPELAWKSKRHHDGTMYDNMFIVGINTPQGQATYHYDIDPYWDMFHVRELAEAPKWDGHTPAQAIDRIASLGTAPENKALTLEQLRQMDGEPVWCVDGTGEKAWCLLDVDSDGCPNAIDKDSGLWDGIFYNMREVTGPNPDKLHVLGWLAYAHKPGKEKWSYKDILKQEG